MRAQELVEWMKGGGAYADDALADLKNLLEEYPYFQAAQLLYTLHLQATKDSRFNAELRKAACYASDRRNLFYHIRRDFFPPEWIERPEKEGAEASPFDRIDSFLAEQGETVALDVASLSMVATDYLSYALAETRTVAETETAEDVPLRRQDVIDRFLEKSKKASLKIVPRDDAASTPFPDLDTVDENNFFSETLAKIYLKQRKYEKALTIIRQLYLLYPEKNRYFADQIRFLEKIVSNIRKIK
jgi:hypothetical protein